MKVEQYFYAVEIADTGSFSQAARNLFISDLPTVWVPPQRGGN